MNKNPVKGDFDFEHLCKVHEKVFEKVYPWAGSPRIINIQKREKVLGELSVEYADCDKIQRKASMVLKKMHSVQWDKVTLDERVIVTDLKDDKGKDNFPTYVKDNIQKNNLVAVNMKKANQMLLSIGGDFPKANTFVSFDKSIAYTTANVNYPEEKTLQQNITANVGLQYITAKTLQASKDIKSIKQYFSKYQI